MARIVFGWEFGASLGHVYPLLRVADVLKNRGHEVIFVCRDVERSFDVVKARGYALIQAPFWKNPPLRHLRSIPTPSYADVLARQGFAYRNTVRSMMSAWDDILSLLEPDLIIADHSPGLNLAVRGTIPVINIGNGFTLPPSEMESFPQIITKGKSLVSEQRLLDMFNDLHRERGRPLMSKLPEIFDTEGQFVCTLPQLDPYKEQRRRLLCGPLEECLDQAPLPEKEHIFLYMANEAEDSEVALQAVKDTNCSATVYIRGASAERRKKFASDAVKMLDKPVSFSEMLPKATLVLHSGGGGTATSCLMTGRPQITFPRQSEANLSAKLLVKQGLGRPVPPSIKKEELTEIISRTLGDRDLKDRCQQVAAKISQGDWGRALEKVTRRAEELLSS
ncbi:MAG: hypothetical protein MI743_13250 [Sneathiellales bacterium]|nr:hypothetical protein [Sneathiellales bacterium]